MPAGQEVLTDLFIILAWTSFILAWTCMDCMMASTMCHLIVLFGVVNWSCGAGHQFKVNVVHSRA